MTLIIVSILALLLGYVGGGLHAAYIVRIRPVRNHDAHMHANCRYLVTENPFNKPITRRAYTEREDAEAAERAKKNPEDFT